ncbi:acyl-CoA Delta(11) desaturase-like [Cydia pomonella]|uniref:acyl-CoA Delta(11) desaturase-like n=1 Tax=Cydia pomonella TaxID=82600 RepID=UPI002ADD3CCC|nr:acyl-CoA Delta(11) desaturase-like [Cydia pomonella]
MAPNVTHDEVEEEPRGLPKLVAPQADSYRFHVSYFTVLLFLYWHVGALYGLYLCFTSARWHTIFYAAIMTELSTLGTFCGAHRLWSHKSYKAKLPLEIILVILQTLGGQNSVYTWVRDHRMHHRYSDTDGDPHNATRGFFYSHIGHAFVHKHPEVKRRGKDIDMSDILNNPVLAFQRRYALPIFILIGYIIPTTIPLYFWKESFNIAFHANILRFVFSLNYTCLINSAAHMFGNRPYDKKVMATENLSVMLVTLGEGSHNYHHVFPWDYRAAELGSWLNFSKTFIDFFAWMGWAYDLKIVDQKSVTDRVKRTGDETYFEM